MRGNDRSDSACGSWALRVGEVSCLNILFCEVGKKMKSQRFSASVEQCTGVGQIRVPTFEQFWNVAGATCNNGCAPPQNIMLDSNLFYGVSDLFTGILKLFDCVVTWESAWDQLKTKFNWILQIFKKNNIYDISKTHVPQKLMCRTHKLTWSVLFLGGFNIT